MVSGVGPGVVRSGPVANLRVLGAVSTLLLDCLCNIRIIICAHRARSVTFGFIGVAEREIIFWVLKHKIVKFNYHK